MEQDARHCVRMRPGMHETPPAQLPDILVPHYEDHCRCFSCRWIRETKCPFLLSKTGQAEAPYPVANPTHDRVSQDERQRLLTHVPKKKFQIMYIYAMQLEDQSWGWVVVLPLPLLPFLLTDEKYSGISKFARNPRDGWFGLKAGGERVDIEQEMVPPLYNYFYQYYGYHPQCSPYHLYRPSPEGDTSGNEDMSSSDDHTPPPKEAHATSTSANRASPAAEELPSPPAEVQTNTPLEAKATSSFEAQTTSSKPPTDQSTSDEDEWLVIDTRCANPPEPSGPCSDNCKFPSHNAGYYGPRWVHRETYWFNTTIFVGGLNASISEADLHHWFQGFGELMHVRKKKGTTSGFVQYPGRKEAEMAMSQMQGFPISGARLRLSWGKPEQQMDKRYWEYYKESAWKAFRAYEDFKARISRYEPRRENDPDFW